MSNIQWTLISVAGPLLIVWVGWLAGRHDREKHELRRKVSARSYAQMDGVPVVSFTPSSEIREMYATGRINELELEQMSEVAAIFEEGNGQGS